MGIPESVEKHVELAVENVGGIDETAVSFTPGVTVLAGRNATNRTSFLQALMAGLGSDDVSVKGDADEAVVDLTVDGETYTRHLYRNGSSIVTEGEPYLEDPELAELFVFLLESNEARRAVELGWDLRELIMRPVDTAAIEAEIDELVAERDDLERRLENLSALKRQLPELEQRRQELESQIESKRADLAETKDAIEDADREATAKVDREDDFEAALEAFRTVRGELEDLRYDLETEQESIEALDSEISDLEAELTSLSETPLADVDEIDAQIDELRSRREQLDGTVTDLQNVIQFNEEMLEGTSSEVVAALRDEDTEDVTDRLVEDTVVCWTCGSDVDTDAIEGTVERLRALRREKLQERRELRTDIDELKTQKATHEERRRQRNQLEDKLERARDERDQRRERVADLEAKRDRLEGELANREAEVEALQAETQSELLELHREANSIEFELGQLQGDLDDVTAEIEDVESQLEKRDQLEARRDEISDEITELRTRIDQIETEAVEQFNEHMESVLDVLAYENLARIWIERRKESVAETQGSVGETTFDLHVVRSTEDGKTYEDAVDHLSESEREVTGLIFALAGYLTHDVHDTCPFILLDSIEAIDSNRIARLVDYVADYAEYVVVALLPEDAGALEADYDRITEI